MKVGPCISACLGSSDQNASNTWRRATVAASGSVPPVSAFDNVMISGTTAAASQANMVPVKTPRAPNPAIFIHVAAPTIPAAWEQYLVAA